MKLVLRVTMAFAAAAMLGGGAAGDAGPGADSARSGNTLAVRDGGRWITWWREGTAPARWEGDAPLAGRVAWRRGADGVEWGELVLRGASEAWRTRIIVARLDPRRLELSLAPAFTEGRTWTVGDAGEEAALALDAGQFRNALPWGWVVSGGKEVLRPQYAPLAGAVVIDAGGTCGWSRRTAWRLSAAAAPRARRSRAIRCCSRTAACPSRFERPGLGVNLRHRDARLALGTLADGRVVVALTRFDALGESLGRVPFGLTSPEMAAVMGALGCRQALLLDGGISSQLSLRDADGATRTWPGTRSVPLGLVGRPRR